MGVIYLIAVKPDYQKCGIGAMLIDTLKNHGKSRGIKAIRALVPQNDTDIVKYFEKAGFRPSNVINFDKPCSG